MSCDKTYCLVKKKGKDKKVKTLKWLLKKIRCSILSSIQPYFKFRINEIINFQAHTWSWILAITNGFSASPQHYSKVKQQGLSGTSKNSIYLIVSFMYSFTTEDKIKPIEARNHFSLNYMQSIITCQKHWLLRKPDTHTLF